MALIECPEHEGSFDCTPFCPTCGGDQEYECPHTYLGERYMGDEYYCLNCGQDVEPSY